MNVIEDKLTRQERRRLESFAQSIASSFTMKGLIPGDRPTLNDLFEQAKKIEAFLKEANPN